METLRGSVRVFGITVGDVHIVSTSRTHPLHRGLVMCVVSCGTQSHHRSNLGLTRRRGFNDWKARLGEPDVRVPPGEIACPSPVVVQIKT
jgi:hypothetical protein